MTGRPCLFIMPRAFYGMATVLTSALEDMGYEVTLANDEYPESAIGKLLGKLDLPLARWLTRRAFRRQGLLDRRWDLVLIIKGRGIGPPLINDLRCVSGRIVGYHFDAMDYDPACIRWTGHVDRVSTFDPVDAGRHGWPLVELFAATPPGRRDGVPRHRISAILRNHSQRLSYVTEVLDALGEHEAFVHIFEKSRLTWLWSLVRHPRLTWRWRKSISFAPLPYPRYLEVLEGSAFTIDFAHPSQSGVTIRCFEARAKGTRLITNNPYTVRSRHFRPGNVILHAPGGDARALAAAIAAAPATPADPEGRSPQTFLREILDDTETDSARG